MSSFFRRRRELDLEDELRRARPEPRPEFLAMLSDRVRESRRPARSPMRLAFAAALSIGVLVALSAVGGLGYAASAVQSATHAVVQVVKPAKAGKPRIVKSSAAADQYGPRTVTICHRPGTPAEKTLHVPPSAVPAHRRHGDIIGSSCAQARKKQLGVFKPGKGKGKAGKKGKGKGK